MKKIAQLIKFKKPDRKIDIDEKTIFYIFEKIMREEYGRRGSAMIKTEHYKSGKIFLKSQSSNWANEIWLNKENIINKINERLGSDEISEIKI